MMSGRANRMPNTELKSEKKLLDDVNLKDTYARERRTQEADIATINQARSDHEPLSLAATPGTTKIPEPIVPPTPRLTSSNNPSDRLYEPTSAIYPLSYLH
jgi:hypothetical protein